MNILMIDIGNTTADFRVWNSKTNSITNFIRPFTNDQTHKSASLLIQLLKKENLEINEILYVSVVPEWNEVIRALGEKLQIEVNNIRNLVDLNSTDIDIDDATKIGADFICNYYAAKKIYNLKNGIIVSMGTATTFLLIQSEVIIGTIIAPGLTVALNGLINNAALLKSFQYTKSNKLIGKNTVDAINLGAYNSHFLMTKATIDKIKCDYKIEDVIYTGGNSLLFEEDIKNNFFKFNEQLIFEGIVDISKNFLNKKFK